MVEKMAFRGYEEYDFDIAIQAAVELGWAEPAARPGTFRLTQEGVGLRAQAERLTAEYFYRPWSVLSPEELAELYALLTKLRAELAMYRKSRSGS